MQLSKFAKKKDWKIYKEYIDKESGAKANRPQFKLLFEEAHQNKFDIVLFWALDRFTREGLQKTIEYLTTLESFGVDFISYTEQYLNSLGIFKDARIGLLATLAKQERIRMSERVKAGLERARREGKKLGRPRI